MTTEKNDLVLAPSNPDSPTPVELPVASQKKVLALKAARGVIATSGGIFGNSSIKDGFDHYTLMTLADYILEQPDEPGESEPDRDQITDEEAAQIPNVTEKIGATFTARLGDAVLQDILGPGVRIRKLDNEREVELPAGVETIRYGSEPGYWVVAADRPLVAEFDRSDLEDAIRQWPGLQSEKGNPVREVTNGVVIGKQVYDSFINEWVGYSHGGRL